MTRIPKSHYRYRVVYTKWGRTTCPSTSRARLLYARRAAGTHFEQKGGGPNYLCLLEQPKYSTQWRIQGGSLGSYKLPLCFFSGVGTVAAVAALAATLFGPYINIHNLLS